MDVTKETLMELGDQIKDMLEGVAAKLDDYRFTVTSTKSGLEIEFYVKGSLLKKKEKLVNTTALTKKIKKKKPVKKKPKA